MKFLAIVIAIAGLAACFQPKSPAVNATVTGSGNQRCIAGLTYIQIDTASTEWHYWAVAGGKDGPLACR